RVAQIEERHAAVVTATADPAGEGDGLSDVLLAELTGGMGAQHEVSFWWGRQVMARPGAGALDGRHARAWMAHLTARGERSRHCGPVARAMAPVDSSTVRPARAQVCFARDRPSRAVPPHGPRCARCMGARARCTGTHALRHVRACSPPDCRRTP